MTLYVKRRKYMYQIAINDPMVYLDGETYAKENHSSLEELVNKYVASLAALIRSRKDSNVVPFAQSEEFKKALAFVKTKAAKGGAPVPVDEDGLDALVEAKYKL